MAFIAKQNYMFRPIAALFRFLQLCLLKSLLQMHKSRGDGEIYIRLFSKEVVET